MPHDDADTDPSTPEARGRTDPGPAAGTGARITPTKIVPVAPVNVGAANTEPMARAPGTDPGVAPPSSPTAGKPPRMAPAPPRPPSRPPSAAKTPPMPLTAPVAKPNDSIDVLLDGITGSPADKPRSTAQTRGEASASYEGSHELLPKQPTPPPEPSVIVERAKQPPTVKLDRSQLQQLAAAMPPPPSERPVTHGAEPTFVTPRSQGPRVVIALFAAILVVFVIFIAMKSWTTKVKQNASAADPSASAFINGKEPPPKSWTPNATASTAQTSTPAVATDTAATATPSATPTSATTSKPTYASDPTVPNTSPTPRPSGKPAPKGTSGGEVKRAIDY